VAVSTEQPDPLERACSLVGRFLSHGRLEQKIDQAVIKFSDLDERAAPMLGIIDFVRKLDLVRDCAYAHIGKNAKDKKFAATTYKRVQRINNNQGWHATPRF
jgi:hypothetical protein